MFSIEPPLVIAVPLRTGSSKHFRAVLLAAAAVTLLSASACFAGPATPGTAAGPGGKSGEVAIGNPASLELNEKGIAAVRAGKFDEAENLFRQALAADPKNLTAVFNLAGTLLRNSKSAAAVSLLSDYTKEYQKDAGLFYRLGDAQFASRKVNEAAGSYEKVLSLDPAYPGAAAKLGTLYALMNRTADAERMLWIAVEQNPNDGKSLGNLSALLVANGKAQKAVGTAKRALQLSPSAELYVTLGKAYEAINDSKNALIAFQRAVDLGDKREELSKKIEALKASQ